VTRPTSGTSTVYLGQVSRSRGATRADGSTRLIHVRKATLHARQWSEAVTSRTNSDASWTPGSSMGISPARACAAARLFHFLISVLVLMVLLRPFITHTYSIFVYSSRQSHSLSHSQQRYKNNPHNIRKVHWHTLQGPKGAARVVARRRRTAADIARAKRWRAVLVLTGDSASRRPAAP
jgi:hypothetical protein